MIAGKWWERFLAAGFQSVVLCGCVGVWEVSLMSWFWKMEDGRWSEILAIKVIIIILIVLEKGGGQLVSGRTPDQRKDRMRRETSSRILFERADLIRTYNNVMTGPSFWAVHPQIPVQTLNWEWGRKGRGGERIMFWELEEKASVGCNSNGASLTAPLSHLSRIQEQRDDKTPQQRKW